MRLDKETRAPESGRYADAYDIASTALMLDIAARNEDGHDISRRSRNEIARHAVTLHRISAALNRLDTKACNEDCHCRACDGEGNADVPGEPNAVATCGRCSGTGSRLGRQRNRLMDGARGIASLYGLAVFHQSDPRGCSLYLGPDAETLKTDYHAPGCWAVVGV